MYEEILQTAANEAAASATDAFGAGCEPPAAVAYEFIRTLWEDTDEPAVVYLPDEMPAPFATAYYARLRR